MLVSQIAGVGHLFTFCVSGHSEPLYPLNLACFFLGLSGKNRHGNACHAAPEWQLKPKNEGGSPCRLSLYAGPITTTTTTATAVRHLDQYQRIWGRSQHTRYLVYCQRAWIVVSVLHQSQRPTIIILYHCQRAGPML